VASSVGDNSDQEPRRTRRWPSPQVASADGLRVPRVRVRRGEHSWRADGSFDSRDSSLASVESSRENTARLRQDILPLMVRVGHLFLVFQLDSCLIFVCQRNSHRSL
jgi:hypothetical protein